MTAFAMVLGEDAETFMARLGHDGSQVIFPHLSEPMCRRGHHIQEILYWMFVRGFKAMPIQIIPMIGDPSGKERPVPVQYVMDNAAKGPGEETPDTTPGDTFEENYRRFTNTINQHVGVIEGVGYTGKRHAVAFSRGRIYDPDGFEYPFTPDNCAGHGFHPDIAWVVE